MAILNLTLLSIEYDDIKGEVTFFAALPAHGGLLPLPSGAGSDFANVRDSTLRIGPVKIAKGSTTPYVARWENPPGTVYEATWDGAKWSAPVIVYTPPTS